MAAEDEVQISCAFWTKLGPEFRVPETPIVSGGAADRLTGTGAHRCM